MPMIINWSFLEIYAIRGMADKFSREQAELLVAFSDLAWTNIDPREELIEVLAKEHRLDVSEYRNKRPEGHEIKLLLALDYALPRMTTASSTVSEAIIQLWDTLSPDGQLKIVQRIEHALAQNRAENSIDRTIWKHVLNHAGHPAAPTTENNITEKEW